MLILGFAGACASFDGAPKLVLPSTTAVEMTEKDHYPVDKALAAFSASADSARSDLSRRDWRNLVAGIYMAAIDARYARFKIMLSRQSKSTNLAFGTLALGLASGGAVVASERAANLLSAGAAAATGTQTQINEKLYFEKTLPALISGMEAGRNRIKANMLERLRDEDASIYPLHAVFADLSALEAAASLDVAIQQVTTDAAKSAAVQQDRIETLYEAPEVAEGMTERLTQIRLKVVELYGRADKSMFLEVAKLAGAQDAASLESKFATIVTYLGSKDLDGLNEFARQAKEKVKEDF